VYLGGTLFTIFFMLCPMILLAISIAILGEHTCLACLKSDAPLLLAALGTAMDHLVAILRYGMFVLKKHSKFKPL
jgi:hypothetical protein